MPYDRVDIMLKLLLKRASYAGSATQLLILLMFMIGCSESLSLDSDSQASADLS